MESDRLARWLTLGANIGVVVGIILLVIELNQNKDMMRANIRNEITRNSVGFLYTQATNPQLVEILIKANNDPESLTPTEEYMYISRSEGVFRHWQNAHYQYRQGMYDDAEYRAHLESMKVIIFNNEGLERYWCQNRNMYPAPFVAEINKITAKGFC